MSNYFMFNVLFGQCMDKYIYFVCQNVIHRQRNIYVVAHRDATYVKGKLEPRKEASADKTPQYLTLFHICVR